MKRQSFTADAVEFTAAGATAVLCVGGVPIPVGVSPVQAERRSSVGGAAPPLP